jgi:hypothetical protein
VKPKTISKPMGRSPYSQFGSRVGAADSGHHSASDLGRHNISHLNRSVVVCPGWRTTMVTAKCTRTKSPRAQKPTQSDREAATPMGPKDALRTALEVAGISDALRRAEFRSDGDRWRATTLPVLGPAECRRLEAALGPWLTGMAATLAPLRVISAEIVPRRALHARKRRSERGSLSDVDAAGVLPPEDAAWVIARARDVWPLFPDRARLRVGIDVTSGSVFVDPEEWPPSPRIVASGHGATAPPTASRWLAGIKRLRVLLEATRPTGHQLAFGLRGQRL